MEMPSASRLDRLSKAQGANREESKYAIACRAAGVRVGRKRYFTGLVRGQWGAGGDHSGKAKPKRPNNAPPYNPADPKHAKVVYAGGLRLHGLK